MRWYDKKILSLAIGCFIFIAANMFFVAQDNYLFGLLPVALAVFLLMFYSLELVLFVIVFCAPFSIPLRYFFPTLGFDLNIPTEPLLIAATLVFVLKLIVEQRFDKRILSHPVSYAIFAYLIWFLFTSVTSTMPLVSFKALICRVWFITVFYFLATAVFLKKSNIYAYVWAYALSMVMVVTITLVKHSTHFFDHNSAYLIMRPFFDDHTSYGAALALIIPPMIGVWLFHKSNLNVYFFTGIAVIILLVGIMFSYTRAAWVGLAASFGIFLIIMFQVKFKTIVAGLAILLLVVAPLRTEIYFMMKGNNTDSSTDFMSHVESMSNISTDQSNVERLNRWSCAWRMFLDKPVVGYGPGTYMFKYGSYQLSWERSDISTNAANLGNAHSEYLGPLAEEGFLGPLLFIAIIVTTMYTAMKIIKKSKNGLSKMYAMTFMLGLVTYYLHGAMNDFLDLDKITALFWGFTAGIVAIDVYHFEEDKEETKALQV